MFIDLTLNKQIEEWKYSQFEKTYQVWQSMIFSQKIGKIFVWGTIHVSSREVEFP